MASSISEAWWKNLWAKKLKAQTHSRDAKVPELEAKLGDTGKLSGRVERVKAAIRGAIAIGTSLGGLGNASATSQVAETAEWAAARDLACEGLIQDVVETLNDVSSLV